MDIFKIVPRIFGRIACPFLSCWLRLTFGGKINTPLRSSRVQHTAPQKQSVSLFFDQSRPHRCDCGSADYLRAGDYPINRLLAMEQMARNQSRAATQQYSSLAQLLHWAIAICMFIALPLAWVMCNMPPNAPDHDSLFTLHKSFGLTIVGLTIVRLIWRALCPAPAYAHQIANWERAIARATYLLLYCVLLGMPLTGYILSSAGGHSVTYFDLFTLPELPKDEALSKAAMWLHVAVGQWLVYGLIGLHLIGVGWHVAVQRDGVLDRMLPAQHSPCDSGDDDEFVRMGLRQERRHDIGRINLHESPDLLPSDAAANEHPNHVRGAQDSEWRISADSNLKQRR
jgi:cytochrome b561